jgi:hypothetical protein
MERKESRREGGKKEGATRKRKCHLIKTNSWNEIKNKIKGTKNNDNFFLFD